MHSEFLKLPLRLPQPDRGPVDAYLAGAQGFEYVGMRGCGEHSRFVDVAGRNTCCISNL